MKITRRQLRGIIREELEEGESWGGMRPLGPSDEQFYGLVSKIQNVIRTHFEAQERMYTDEEKEMILDVFKHMAEVI